MWSCSDDEGKINTGLVNNPASATESANSKEPKIEFAVTEHDFGKMIQGEQVSFTYKFKNTGNAPLIISSVDKSCGCTASEYPRQPIEPGQKGDIKITYDSKGHHGFQSKTVTVNANTMPAQTTIRIKAEVRTPDNY